MLCDQTFADSPFWEPEEQILAIEEHEKTTRQTVQLRKDESMLRHNGTTGATAIQTANAIEPALYKTIRHQANPN